MDQFGLTQTEAAKRLGVSQATIQRVLAGTGVRGGPARRRIAKALARIQNSDDDYSSSSKAADAMRDLQEKVAQMCDREGDAAVLEALLDAVTAYRRRTGE